MREYYRLIPIIYLCIIWSAKQQIPDIALKDLSNKKQKISQYYENGPMLMNFWNLACEPCKKEMKELDKLYLKYRNKGFEYISINIDSPRSMSKVKSYINSQNFSFKVLSDPKASLFRKTGGKVMPFVIVVDTIGTILSKHVGYNPGDEKKLEQEIISLLGINPLVNDTLKNDLNKSNIPVNSK